MNEIRSNAAPKWLNVMFYVTLLSMANSVITVIPAVPPILTTWISRGIMFVMIFCSYQLRTQNEHYQKAAIYRTVMVVCSLASAYIFKSTALTLLASFLSILAVFQEYSAHAELIEEKEPALAGKWHSLFNWGLAVGLLISFGTMIAAVVIALLEMAAASAAAWILAVLALPQIIIDLVYVKYLRRMVCLLEE